MKKVSLSIWWIMVNHGDWLQSVYPKDTSEAINSEPPNGPIPYLNNLCDDDDWWRLSDSFAISTRGCPDRESDARYSAGSVGHERRAPAEVLSRFCNKNGEGLVANEPSGEKNGQMNGQVSGEMARHAERIGFRYEQQAASVLRVYFECSCSPAIRVHRSNTPNAAGHCRLIRARRSLFCENRLTVKSPYWSHLTEVTLESTKIWLIACLLKIFS